MVRRDDDLVRAERPQLILDRLKRIGFAHLAVAVDPDLAQPRKAVGEPVLGLCPRRVFIRGDEPHAGEEGRADHPHPLVEVLSAAADLLAQGLPADGLVRDHEDPPLTRRATTARRGPHRRLATGTDDPSDRGAGEDHEHRHTEPAVDRRRNDDQREVPDRKDDQTERVGLTLEGIPHGVLQRR